MTSTNSNLEAATGRLLKFIDDNPDIVSAVDACRRHALYQTQMDIDRPTLDCIYLTEELNDIIREVVTLKEGVA